MMERWTALGNGIAKRMPYLVLVCLATGVLLPDVFSPFKGIVPVLFAFMTFQGALSNTFHQIIEVFRRPVQLLVILGITSVAMPVAASALAHLFFAHNTQIVCGIIIEYCMPVAVVSIMWVGMFAGNGALGLAAVLVSTVISPFTIPLTLQLLLGASVQIDIAGMMTQMIFMIALPALAGTALNDVTRGWGHKRLSVAAYHYHQFNVHEPVCAAYDMGARCRDALHPAIHNVRVLLGPYRSAHLRRALSQPHHHELLLRAAQHLFRHGHRRTVLPRRSGLSGNVRHHFSASARLRFWKRGREAHRERTTA